MNAAQRQLIDRHASRILYALYLAAQWEDSVAAAYVDCTGRENVTYHHTKLRSAKRFRALRDTLLSLRKPKATKIT